MPYNTLATRIRNDPYGPQGYAGLIRNTQYLRNYLGAQHVYTTGEHNVMEVPRVCRQISGTTVGPSSSDITAVTNPTAGEFDLTLAAGRFTAGNIRAQVMVGSGGDLKPYTWNVEIVSATSVKVRFQKLTSALGAGNVWAATNANPWSIALHSDPVSPGSWAALGRPVTAGLTLSADIATAEAYWDQFPREAAQLYASLTAAHTSAGVHNVREVARYWGRVDSTTPKIVSAESSPSFGAVTRSSAGVFVVNYPGTLTTPVSVFASPFYSSAGAAGDMYLLNTASGTTACTFYIYKYVVGSNWWVAADADFAFAVHGS